MSAAVRIAIDGPAGSGKSTLARGLARRLGLPYVNTGLMYRALTMHALEHGIGLDDADTLEGAARTLSVDLDETVEPPELRIEGHRPGPELTSPRVEGAVSLVSSHPAVRAVLVERQRALADHGAVMEGRDIGRVVLPDATVKIYLDAHQDERTERRELERGEDDLADALAARDRQDAETNPFVPADDAVRLDTSGRTAEETLEAALRIVAEHV
ncbi:MAG TPA: (d)CMP kinase, partial [Actinomycetota bacterium]|nr:(d)CMP kinase [Actinomycetota bacterium]